MIPRLIYRILIRLHPRNFRELHGDELLCIFDESAPDELGCLLVDGMLSFARQWVIHSSWWKFLAGAAVSTVLVLACGYSISQSFNWSLVWGAQRHADLLVLYPSPDPSFNAAEFESEAQQAVRMLAQYRRGTENDRHDGARRRPDAPNQRIP